MGCSAEYHAGRAPLADRRVADALFTGTAVNVQSLLGFIFIVGINVSNAVLMTDFAQELRFKEGLTPGQAIRKSAAIRVRPVTMTAMAAFFAMLPGAFALERGSEANAPLARAILGGLLAVEPSTLFVLPCLYSLLVRDRRKTNNTETDGNERTDEGFLGEQDDQGFDSPHGEV